MNIFIITTTLIYLKAVFSFSPTNPCYRAKPGLYCTADLGGYYKCDGNHAWPRATICGPEKRCTCYLNRKCGMEQKDICQTYRKAKGFPKHFLAAFHGYKITQTTNGIQTKQRVDGVVREDYAKKGFRSATKVGNVIYYLLIIKNKGDPLEYFEYTWDDSSNHCEKRVRFFFPSYFDSLRRYTLKSETNYVQNWLFLRGPKNDYDRTEVKKWRFERYGSMWKPAAFSKNIHGGSSKQPSIDYKVKFGLFYNIPIHEAWFRVPSQCRHTKRINDEDIQYHQ